MRPWERRLILAAVPAAFAAAGFLGPSRLDSWPRFNLLEWLTGYSPSVGLSRGLAALLRGQWGLALEYNPLAPLVALGLAALWLWALAGTFSRGGARLRR